MMRIHNRCKGVLSKKVCAAVKPRRYNVLEILIGYYVANHRQRNGLLRILDAVE